MTQISQISGNAMLLSFIVACSGCCMGEPSGAGFHGPAPLSVPFLLLMCLGVYGIIGLVALLAVIVSAKSVTDWDVSNADWRESLVGILIFAALWPIVLFLMALISRRAR